LIILAFDTETTGKLEYRLPATDARQPDIVQIGAILYDTERDQVRGELNVIVKPEGRFTVPAEAANVHGIQTEDAERFGIPLIIALAAFNNLGRLADAFVCHNIGYDIPVSKKAYHILGKPHPFDEKPSICTMLAMTPILKLPKPFKARPDDPYKWPNLQEAYAHVTGGGTFDGAHDAMADVRATITVFKWVNQQQEAA
jgi:DNA polymerase III epsilon subunit-like protein